jgi:hypothetical protein
MALWQNFTRLIPGRRSSARRWQMKLTGQPPANPAEKLVQIIAGDRLELPLEWLRKKVCHELYVEELRLTRYMADIGLGGRDLFRREAGAVLSGVRPEFGSICEACRKTGSRESAPG